MKKEAYYTSLEKDVTIFNDDNLEVLKSLPDESINLIYCDILYNSGKEFKDYNDDLGKPDAAMDWYRPRIYQMRRVLKNNGTIFIHCNWRLISHMRIIMDEIFGESSFKNKISRKHSDLRGFYKNYDSQIDEILYYVKDPENYVFNEIKQSKEVIIPLYENGTLKGKTYNISFKGEVFDLVEKEKHWRVSKKEFEELAKKDEVISIKGMPYRYTNIQFLGNLWDTEDMYDSYSRIDENDAYDTPKPEPLLERVIEIHSNIGDTVGDFFLGGGTTAVVAKKLGRRGVYADINQKACDITISKLDKILEYF